MNATTVAVDLAKSVFQIAVADASWRIIEKHRLTRTQFERFFANRAVRLARGPVPGRAFVLTPTMVRYDESGESPT